MKPPGCLGARPLDNLRWHDLPWNCNVMTLPCELRSGFPGAPDPALEGHIHRLKLIKRHMYGRANLDLLRIRVLHTA